MKKFTNKRFFKISLFFLFIIIALGIALGNVWHLKNKKRAASLVSQPKDVKIWEADPRPLQNESATIKQIKEINKENKGKKYISKKNETYRHSRTPRSLVYQSKIGESCFWY